MTARTIDFTGFVRAVRLERDTVPSFDGYPFSIPAVRDLQTLELDPKVTFLVGDNGSGKSTLVEAIAIAAGFNAEGGSKHMRFATRSSESVLHQHLRLLRSPRRLDGFFLRAESLFNVATQIDNLDIRDAYCGASSGFLRHHLVAASSSRVARGVKRTTRAPGPALPAIGYLSPLDNGCARFRRASAATRSAAFVRAQHRPGSAPLARLHDRHPRSHRQAAPAPLPTVQLRDREGCRSNARPALRDLQPAS